MSSIDASRKDRIAKVIYMSVTMLIRWHLYDSRYANVLVSQLTFLPFELKDSVIDLKTPQKMSKKIIPYDFVPFPDHVTQTFIWVVQVLGRGKVYILIFKFFFGEQGSGVSESIYYTHHITRIRNLVQTFTAHLCPHEEYGVAYATDLH